MKKPIKTLVIVLAVGISAYNAIFIEPLDAYHFNNNKSALGIEFLVEDFIANKIESISALNTITFLAEISSNPIDYSLKNGKKLGISDDYNFIVEGQGKVISIEEENIILELNHAEKQNIRLAIDFIFGNAIRDGSGIADIGNFQNTMDFNTISVLLNNFVREKIVPPFQSEVRAGSVVYFKGAVKVNAKSPNTETLRVIPLQLNFKS